MSPDSSVDVQPRQTAADRQTKQPTRLLFLGYCRLRGLLSPYLTTLRSGLCYRKSVCRLSVCLSSATFVRHAPGVEIFANISSPFCTLAVLRSPCQILRRSSQGNSSVGSVKRNRGSKIKRCRVRVSHLLMRLMSFL